MRRPDIRMGLWLFIAAALLGLVATIAPQQLPVVLAKLSLVTIGVVLAYWLDRGLFPYARPHDFAHDVSTRGMLLYAACMIRRAIVVFAVIIGVTLGL